MQSNSIDVFTQHLLVHGTEDQAVEQHGRCAKESWVTVKLDYVYFYIVVISLKERVMVYADHVIGWKIILIGSHSLPCPRWRLVQPMGWDGMGWGHPTLSNVWFGYVEDEIIPKRIILLDLRSCPSPPKELHTIVPLSHCSPPSHLLGAGIGWPMARWGVGAGLPVLC